MNRMKKISYLSLALLIISVPLYCFRAGSFFGGMAAGGLMGGLIGNSIGRDNARRQDVVYAQQQPQVVYVRDAQPSQPTPNNELLRIQRENAELRARLDRLERNPGK